jgi:hypothetical protein
MSGQHQVAQNLNTSGHAHHPPLCESRLRDASATGAPVGHAHAHPAESGTARALSRLALAATLHCLTGCGIGEVLGMVLGTVLGLSDFATVGLAVALAFFFGYLLTLLPLRRAGLPWAQATRLALAADTASITVMEIVDNAVMLAIPGAMDAGLADPLFWGSLVGALALAAVAAFTVNRWLIARGRGHAVAHAHHRH